MKLENERYEVTFVEEGGEIYSFTDKQTGIQYMWQGDAEHWGGKNPSLFPIVGNTYSGTYEIDGKRYAMKNHGLIRYAKLTCTKQDERQVVFELHSDEETKRQYPFDFHYAISYTLENNMLTINYDIRNDGDADMPFSFGLHPGFNCPLTADEKFTDYHLHFSNPEYLQQMIMDRDKIRPPYIETSSEAVQDIPLTYDWIQSQATIIYKDVRSAYVSLMGKEHGVRVSLIGYPLLAIWTAKTGAPFLCIEPWMGHADFHDVKEDFYHREGTMILSSGNSFTTSYTIEVF